MASNEETQMDESGYLPGIFGEPGEVGERGERHFETVTNIRTWINHTDMGECCKMQIL
jgi:hypothetical protein